MKVVDHKPADRYGYHTVTVASALEDVQSGMQELEGLPATHVAEAYLREKVGGSEFSYDDDRPAHTASVAGKQQAQRTFRIRREA